MSIRYRLCLIHSAFDISRKAIGCFHSNSKSLPTPTFWLSNAWSCLEQVRNHDTTASKAAVLERERFVLATMIVILKFKGQPIRIAVRICKSEWHCASIIQDCPANLKMGLAAQTRKTRWFCEIAHNESSWDSSWLTLQSTSRSIRNCVHLADNLEFETCGGDACGPSMDKTNGWTFSS